MNKTKFFGIFELEKDKKILFFTKNNQKFRLWEPKTSKLAAALHKGMKDTYLKEADKILYLGASTGTTVSHLSDIVGNKGIIFAVEISPTTCRQLVFLAEERQNIAPILADANQPQKYADRISKVDWMYQDISQKNQTEIFIKNSKLFLKEKGFAILALKARSITSVEQPEQIFEETRKQLQKEFKILQEIKLEPYQKDHCLFVCQKK